MALQEVGVRLVLEGQGGFMSGLGDANSAIDRFASQANTGTQGAAGGFSALERIATGALHQVGAAAVQAGAQAAQALGAFVSESVNAAGDFEGNMLRFGAAAGEGFEAGSAGAKQFQDLFIQLGKELPVSTLEAQEAAITLVKGGLDPAVVAAGALRDSLNFAAAAEMGLADAAELSIKMLGTFGDTTASAADQTAFLAQANDLLVKAAGASTLNVDNLGDAMLQAAGQAKAIGLDYSEFVTSMTLVSPAFSSAAEAGTSFKNFLTRLAPSTAPAKEAMAELGLMTTSTGRIMEYLRSQGIEPLGTDLDTLGNQFTEFAAAQGFTAKATAKVWDSFSQSMFFDELTGDFIGVQASAELLQNSLTGLSDVQRIQALTTIFGNDAMGAANALAQGGSEAYTALAEKIAAANGVQGQAASLQEGFNFALNNFQGSIEAVQISLGLKLLPYLETFLGYAGQGVNVAGTFAEALLGSGEAFASLSPQAQAALVALQGFGGQAMQVATWLQGNWQTAVAVGGAVLAAVLVPALAAGAAAFGAAVVAAAPVIAVIAAVGAAAAMLKSIWDQNLGGVQEKTAAVMAAVQSVVQSVLGAVTAFWSENGAEIMAFAQTTWSTVQNIVGTVLGAVLEVVTTIFTAVASFINEHGAEIQLILETAWRTIENVTTVTLNTIQSIINTVLALIKGDWDTVTQEIQNIVEGMATFVGDQFNNLLDLISGLGPEWLDEGVALARSIVDGLVQGVKDNAARLASTLTDMAKNALDAAKSFLGIQSPSKVFAEQVGKPITQGIAEGVLDALPDLQDALDTLGADALKQFEGIATKMGTLIDESLSGRAGMLRSNAGNLDIIGQLTDEQRKVAEARQKFLDNLPLMSREDYETEINSLNRRADVAANQLEYAQRELDAASSEAARIGAIDARSGADFLAKRQAQIKEILGLQQAYNDATDEGSKARAATQLDLVRRAQEIEIQQLKNSLSKRANELGSLGEGYQETGNAIVDGMIKGMQDRSSEMADALKSVLMFALRGAQESLGIRSPSLVFAQDVGAPIAEGIAQGITGSASAALGAINSLTSSLIKPAAPAAGRPQVVNNYMGGNQYHYQPNYNGAPRLPSQDFSAMRVFATSR